MKTLVSSRYKYLGEKMKRKIFAERREQGQGFQEKEAKYNSFNWNTILDRSYGVGGQCWDSTWVLIKQVWVTSHITVRKLLPSWSGKILWTLSRLFCGADWLALFRSHVVNSILPSNSHRGRKDCSKSYEAAKLHQERIWLLIFQSSFWVLRWRFWSGIPHIKTVERKCFSPTLWQI